MVQSVSVDDGAWNLVPSPSDMATSISSFDVPGASEEAPSMLGVVIGAHPVGGTGPKAGFLYIRVLEAGNLQSLFSPPSCCKSSSSGLGYSPCVFSCSGCACNSSRSLGSLHVGLSCICLERPVRTKVAVPVHEETGTATFREEMLLRALNFCSADQIKVTVESGSAVLAEAKLPMRAALPDVLLACAGSDAQDVEDRELNSKTWPPRHRAVLQPMGHEDLSAQGASPNAQQLPYIEIELLQLVDGSLPAALGSKPLLLALENQQEQLVRGYLSFDYVERLSVREQELCLTAAIRRSPFMLLQLLDQIQPTHEHLLLAIRLGHDHLIEPLLQAGGLSLMRSRTQWRRGRGGQGRRRPFADDSRAPQPDDPMPTEGAESTRNERQLTPLALASSLGRVGCVEALCQWARRQRLQVDPSGPQITLLSLGRRDSVSTTVWEDLDATTLGDPPMVMAVRGQGEPEEKLEIISVLCRHNFSVDARSPADSWTPLLAAVERGSSELVEALVAQGARSSPDSLLGFTPLHLACQMGHWHLIPCLVEAMRKQYSSMSAWGPSPQYVSLNVADVYGRTALDIALLRYFSNESENCSAAPASGGNGQKAVNVLREFIHRSPTDDPGVVCGWELLQVLNFIDAIPSKKAMKAQLAECNRIVEGSPNSANADSGEVEKETAENLDDVKEVLQAVRVLVKAGAQTRFLLEDLLEPVKNPPVASPIFKSAAQPARTRPKYSLEEDEVDEMEQSVDDDSCTS